MVGNMFPLNSLQNAKGRDSPVHPLSLSIYIYIHLCIFTYTHIYTQIHMFLVSMDKAIYVYAYQKMRISHLLQYQDLGQLA